MFEDYDDLNSDQLIAKQIEMRRKLTTALNAGMSGQILDQLQTMIDYIGIEIKSKSAIEAMKTGDDDDDSNGDGVSLGIG
tara:strand:+ start:3327 stop:3566 length:240 start_codon:yes stop_codon:yes gene_type:complete